MRPKPNRPPITQDDAIRALQLTMKGAGAIVDAVREFCPAGAPAIRYLALLARLNANVEALVAILGGPLSATRDVSSHPAQEEK